jgi:hypothetical protein
MLPVDGMDTGDASGILACASGFLCRSVWWGWARSVRSSGKFTWRPSRLILPRRFARGRAFRLANSLCPLTA